MASVIDLMRIPVERRTPDHLFEMLRCAVKLEHATLPPYLTAWWSITLPKNPADPKNPSYDILQTIVFEEMGHMGTALNLLTTVGGTPAITDPGFVPKYPTSLPCRISPKVTPPNVRDWKIGLSRLTPAVVSDVFMIIEYPEAGPVPFRALAEAPPPEFHTIGEFYDAIAATLRYLVEVAQSVRITGKKQLSEPFIGHDEQGQNVLNPITSLDEALKAIEHIKEQGEGTPSTPDAPPFGHELAHYYRFKQIQVGRMFQQQADQSWALSGPFFDFPAVLPMADIPDDGYRRPGVPQDVADKIAKFNADYKQLLALLQSAWEKGSEGGGQDDLDQAETTYMDGLSGTARELMSTPIDAANPSLGNYGPTFRVD